MVALLIKEPVNMTVLIQSRITDIMEGKATDFLPLNENQFPTVGKIHLSTTCAPLLDQAETSTMGPPSNLKKSAFKTLLSEITYRRIEKSMNRAKVDQTLSLSRKRTIIEEVRTSVNHWLIHEVGLQHNEIILLNSTVISAIYCLFTFKSEYINIL